MIQISRKFGDLEIIAEGENGKWQLRCGTIASGWTSYYEGLLTLRVGTREKVRTFGYATDYWHGALPTEVPFEIVEGK